MVAAGLVAAFAKLEGTLQQRYPDLRLVFRDEKPLFVGSFPIAHGGEEIDRFSIEISFPDGIDGIPVVREIGGRIPRDSSHHVNQPSGDLCTDVPELILLRGYTFLDFLDGPLRNFFLSQIVTAGGKPWPMGQWNHGKPGLLEAYGELLGVSGEGQIRRFLDYVSRKEVKGHWPCPCGNGQRLRNCHHQQIRDLRSRIPHKIARLALTRLNAYG